MPGMVMGYVVDVLMDNMGRIVTTHVSLTAQLVDIVPRAQRVKMGFITGDITIYLELFPIMTAGYNVKSIVQNAVHMAVA